jgi:hypothetical protein
MLHVRFVKKAVNKAFYSPSQKTGFAAGLPKVFPCPPPPIWPKPSADPNYSSMIPF